MLVQHLRHDTLALALLLRERFRDVSLIAIPYSVDPTAATAAREVGLQVSYPTMAQMPVVIAERLEGLTGEVVVQDVGGYIADYLRHNPAVNLRGIVEETKQGVWRYRSLPTLPVAVTHIAESPLKQIEARYVGVAVACSLVEQLRSLGVSFIGRPLGVLGYGEIGSATARALRGLGALVAVLDVRPSRMIAAEADGFAVLPRERLLRSTAAIVACTGSAAFSPADVGSFNHRLILASGSSRQVEFEEILDRFESGFEVRAGMRVSRILRMQGVQDVLLLNEGFPINFLGESLPRSIIDLVFAQLVIALAYLGEPDVTPGLCELSADDLELVASVWREVYPHYPEVVE